MNVLFVANDSQGHLSLLSTAEFTVERNRFHVMNVRNVFHLRAHWRNMRISTDVNTSAQNVANALEVVVIWQYTVKVIRERNRLNVVFVANDSHHYVRFLSTAELTVETRQYRICVLCVTQRLQVKHI